MLLRSRCLPAVGERARNQLSFIDRELKRVRSSSGSLLMGALLPCTIFTQRSDCKQLKPMGRRIMNRAFISLISASESTSAIMVTHDLDEAMKMGDRVGVLVAGRFVQIDTPEHLFDNPLSVFVAKALPDLLVIEGSIVGQHQVQTGLGVLQIDTSQIDFQIGRSVKLGFRSRDVNLDTKGTSCVVLDIRFVSGRCLVLLRAVDTDERFSVQSNKFHGLSVGQSASIKFATTKPYIYY